MYKILIIKLGALGDVLRTTSILKGLKEKHKPADITWVTKRESLDLLKNNKEIDSLLEFKPGLKNKLKETYDLVICLDDDHEACELSSAVKKKQIIGAYIDKGKKTYTDSASLWFDMGLLSKFGKEKADEVKKKNKKTYQQIMENILGIKADKQILDLAKEEVSYGKAFMEKNNLKSSDLIIGVNTSAGHRWGLKRLPIGKTVDLISKLKNKLNAKVILLGGPEEVQRNYTIVQKTKSIDAGCDNTIMQFAGIMSICNLIIASDSLAMHIALALKKKTVAFFAPTSAAEIEMYSLGKKVISGSECYCCYRKDDDFHPNCMDAIKAEDIFKAVKEII